MKKVILMCFFIVLIVAFKIDVNATSGDESNDTMEGTSGEGSDSSPVKDDEGHLIGEFYFNASYVSGNGVYNITDSYQLGVEVGDDPYGGYLYLVKEATSTDSNYMYGLYGNGKLHYTVTTVQTNNDTDEQQTYTRTESDINLGSGSDLSFHANFAGILTNGMPPVIDTNIPIFSGDNQEAIKVYEETGDYSGAENSTDLAEQDETIELPVGLKVTGGYAQGLESAYNLDKDCVFNWTQTVDTSNYVYDVDCKLTINILNKNIGASSQTSEYYSSGWIGFYEKSYDGANAVTCKVSEEDLNDKLIEGALQAYVSKNGKKIQYKGYVISSLEIRVRNVCGPKASNFVVVKIDKDGNSTTATVQNENGDTISDDEYDGSDVSDKENSVDTDLSDFVDILNFIRNGFGLFGNNGLIAMFRSFFSFLPDTWWTLILVGMGLIIVVGIINFLLKR